MSVASLEGQLDRISHPAPVPRLLVELPSRRRVFFTNLRDLVFPRRLTPLQLRSAPAPFWRDVFVERRLPTAPFLKSATAHLLACALLVAFTRLFALQPVAVSAPAFDHTQVVYYSPSEYLPPIDTRQPQMAHPQKADPEFSRQPIISVPREPDNRAQTIVTPPDVKLKRDIALPNIVAWSDASQKPRLAPPPLTLAADITRIAPDLNSAVVAPPDRVDQTLRPAPALNAPQPAVIAPPPTVDLASNRAVGEINIAPASVIAPAPSLPVAEQRAVPAGRSSAIAPQVVPPPPPVSTGPSPDFGSRGRVVALNLHPSVGAPPNPPAGNRRGAFAVTPEGHPGASGSPGSASGKENGSESNRSTAGDLPSGLYVGSAPKTSPVAGDPAPSNSVNPNLIASLRQPRVTSAPSHATLADAAKLSEPERAIFGGRKFYSVTLNMPNLNSAGGSWVIRFAELNQELKGDASLHRFGNDEEPNASDLSQPQATRKVDPAYPLQLMRENVAGTVILYAVIHANGTIGNIRVLRGVDPRLDKFAIEAVAQWKFIPATKKGAPVDVEATFQIPFRPVRAETNF
ncbi:MAG TPA: TonB family protein [Terriglobales bacterium]|nr:TonB family protein [Terriglobales bacterium]